MPKKEDKRNYEMFAYLPDLFLEDVFARLSIRHRYYASMVCSNWSRIFHSPRIWRTFQMQDRLLTRRKFNYYLGYEHVLDHYRAQICLRYVGHNFRTIIIRPMSNFYNLYEFLNMLSSFAEFYDENPLRSVHTFTFSFACHQKISSGIDDNEQVFGTGGELLKALQRLIINLPGVKNLTLNELLLNESDANDASNEIARHCSETLMHLRLVNLTKDLCPFLNVGMFNNLRRLTISPQQLSDDMLIVLSQTSIRHLHVVQNTFTEIGVSVPGSAWRESRRLSKFHVHLRIEGRLTKEIIWQEFAPVKSVVYESPYSKVTADSILTVVDLYSKDLQIYGHLSLPRFYMARSFHERADSNLVLLCRECPMLHTLIIRQLVSTATVVLIAWTGKRLKSLFVRRNAMIKRADWPRSPDWSSDFFSWLKQTACSYELVQKEVSRLLGVNWTPLSDFQFKSLQINYSSVT
uniref:F-box domain-containing protein n=1 Tax=Strigamia maritima TaxID=126957 RepID=T1IND8_STRMM